MKNLKKLFCSLVTCLFYLIAMTKSFATETSDIYDRASTEVAIAFQNNPKLVEASIKNHTIESSVKCANLYQLVSIDVVAGKALPPDFIVMATFFKETSFYYRFHRKHILKDLTQDEDYAKYYDFKNKFITNATVADLKKYIDECQSLVAKIINDSKQN